MHNKDVSETKIETDALHTAIRRAEAEVERVKRWLAKEQPAAASSKNPGTAVPKVDTHSFGTRNAPQKFRTDKPEMPDDLAYELKALRSEVQSWKAESRQMLIDKNAVDKKGQILASLAIVVTIIFGSVGLWLATNRQTEKLQNLIEAGRFVLTSPSDGANVGPGQKVKGKTPFTQLNHYIAVRIVRTGGTDIRPASVSPDGTFAGEARFVESTAKEDNQFTIRVLATKATLAAGNLTEVPGDAVWSDSVNVRRVQSSPAHAGQIVLTSPTDGDEVDADSTISGKTSLPDLNHYIVATPTQIKTSFVQKQPALVNRDDGSFTWRATFGDAPLGSGEQFTIRILATKSKLPPGPLNQEPADALFSNLITVKRK